MNRIVVCVVGADEEVERSRLPINPLGEYLTVLICNDRTLDRHDKELLPYQPVLVPHTRGCDGGDRPHPLSFFFLPSSLFTLSPHLPLTRLPCAPGDFWVKTSIGVTQDRVLYLIDLSLD